MCRLRLDKDPDEHFDKFAPDYVTGQLSADPARRLPIGRKSCLPAEYGR